MTTRIEQLWRQALHCFTGRHAPGHKLAPDGFERLRSLMNEMTAADVGLDKQLIRNVQDQSTPMCVVEIFENSDITIAVFILNNNVTLPLHDHPEMHGLLKVINGVVNIESFSFDTSSKRLSDNFVPAIRHPPVRLGIADPVSVFTPIERNFHRITCLEGPAAFLDVLSPPYDFDGIKGNRRLCTFYKVEASDAMSDKVRLTVTSPPSNFYSINIDYKGKPLRSPYWFYS